MNEIEKLEIERSKLRKEIRGKSVSTWKIWQFKRDMKLIRNSDRICEINNILKGFRMGKEFRKLGSDE